MPFKKHDFVELDFTGRLKETNEVFDTTDVKIAKDAQVFSEKAEYKPIVICIGEHYILKGIDEFVQGKEPGKYTVDLAPENAFGKKDSKMLKMIPMNKFAEQKIRPVPGLRLNIDGYVGMVKSVSGGRVIVDFNHPLAGREILYELNVHKVVTDKKVQVDSMLKILLGVKTDVVVEEKKVKITLPELPKQLTDELAKKVMELTGLEAEFVKKELKKAEEKKPVEKVAKKVA